MFQFSVSNTHKTDIFLVTNFDSRTQFTVRTVVPEHGKQAASLMAFAGARYSRSSDSIEDIFAEIKEAGSNAQEKLAHIFNNYGHASVADMAQIMVYIENIPKYLEAIFFNETSNGGGQGRSSRYQDYSNSPAISLQNYVQDSGQLQYAEIDTAFQDLQKQALQNYRDFLPRVTVEYTNHFAIDTENKRHLGALKARIFDTVRAFLPSGSATRTSICWITSAREWARIISFLKSQDAHELLYLGEQIEALLAPTPEMIQGFEYTPEAPDLIRYTAADETMESTLHQIEDYILHQTDFLANRKTLTFGYRPTELRLIPNYVTAGEKVLAQNILTIFPDTQIEWLLRWITDLEDTQKTAFSEILFLQFNHHKQMGVQYRVNELSFVMDISITEAIDLNRHRAWGRFSPMWSLQKNYDAVLANGYSLPMYLTENPGLATLCADFDARLMAYYEQVFAFITKVKKLEWFPPYLTLQVLPLAHNAQLFLHASPKELSYMTNLRVRPGGHINYRYIAWRIAQEASKTENLLSALATLPQPDPTSAEEFVDRS